MLACCVSIYMFLFLFTLQYVCQRFKIIKHSKLLHHHIVPPMIYKWDKNNIYWDSITGCLFHRCMENEGCAGSIRHFLIEYFDQLCIGVPSQFKWIIDQVHRSHPIILHPWIESVLLEYIWLNQYCNELIPDNSLAPLHIQIRVFAQRPYRQNADILDMAHIKE